MWKHKNFINLQLYAGPIPYPISVNGEDVLIQHLSDSGASGEDTWNYNASINTDLYTISGNTVVWNNGTVLQYNNIDVLPTDDIIVNGQYTTRSATPTLTFKHFYDAGLQGTGTYKFRHYSQQEPSSGETWVLNETVNISGTNYYNNIEMTYSGQTRVYPIRSLKMYEYSDGPETAYSIYGEEEAEYSEGNSKYGLYSTGGGATGWQHSQSGVAFNTWYFATAPTGDLLTWLQANGTKQGGGGQ